MTATHSFAMMACPTRESTAMIELTRVRELTLLQPPAPTRPAFLSAASGLVVHGDHLYVVADDELHLGVFAHATSAPGSLVQLLAGELPAAPRARKRAKADFEALAQLPPFASYRHGALFALGSGSKRGRDRGVLLALAADGSIVGAPRVIDLAGLYHGLADAFADLNIEGACVTGADFVLFQRGNKGAGENACVRFAAAAVLAALAADDHLDRLHPTALRRYDLGAVGDVPLTFTDAHALADGEIVFSAVAENTVDSYNDGPCAGAAIGALDRAGDVVYCERLAQPYKIEGLHAWRGANATEVLAVTDADDASIAALLLGGRIGG